MNRDHLTHHIGHDGFIWFMGVIEALNDPLRVGRAKVRIIGWHDGDTRALSTAELPWAFPVLPVTASGMLPTYKHGDWVLGFFLDGPLGQQPMIFGVLPSIPQGGGLFGKLKKIALSAAKQYITSQTGIKL